MTTKRTLLKVLAAAGKKVHANTLDRYLAVLKIVPTGARQRPQQYPADTAARILSHLGFSGGEIVTSGEKSVARERARHQTAGILSLDQLRKVRKRR